MGKKRRRTFERMRQNLVSNLLLDSSWIHSCASEGCEYHETGEFEVPKVYTSGDVL